MVITDIQSVASKDSSCSGQTRLQFVIFPFYFSLTEKASIYFSFLAFESKSMV